MQFFSKFHRALKNKDPTRESGEDFYIIYKVKKSLKEEAIPEK